MELQRCYGAILIPHLLQLFEYYWWNLYSLHSYTEPRTEKILNVHSHLLTTRIPFHSDFPFFRILIVSVLMIMPKMLICLRNHQLDLWKILVYGNMNKKQISTLLMLMTLFDLQMTIVNDQWERVVLPNLMLYILIPHLLQLAEYNWNYRENVIPTLLYWAQNWQDI